MANTTFQGADIVSPRETLFEQVRFAGYPRGPTSAADLRLSANLRPCSHREAHQWFVGMPIPNLPPLFAQGDLGNHANPVHVEPSTPVRTGRPISLAVLLVEPTFDPCSHRETSVQRSHISLACLRPLFAQGGPSASSLPPLPSPSTPVRTGRPQLPLTLRATMSFDPCSHRETAPEATYKPPPPSFDPCSHREASGSGSGTSMIRLQALRAGDFQAKARDARMLTPSPAFTGQTEFFRQSFRCQAFQPFVHRVTLGIDSSQIPGALALRPQGKPTSAGIAWTIVPSSPAFAGQPSSMEHRNVFFHFQPCVHRVTLDIDSSQIPGALPALRPQGKPTSAGIAWTIVPSLRSQGNLCRLGCAREFRPSRSCSQGNLGAVASETGVSPSSPAFTGQPIRTTGAAQQPPFQPCVHRATLPCCVQG